MLIKNKIKPKFYSSHRARSGESKTILLQESLLNKAKEGLKENKNFYLEIGFGNGKSVINMALKEKGNYFFCIESYVKGIELLNKKIKEKGLNNIFILYGDAINIIEELFCNKTIAKIFIFFPDPWPKSKHKKRRIINEYSINLFFNKLRNGGSFHFATDNIEYAYETHGFLSDYFSKNEEISFSSHRGDRPITKYEEKALSKKNFIYDIIIKN